MEGLSDHLVRFLAQPYQFRLIHGQDAAGGIQDLIAAGRVLINVGQGFAFVAAAEIAQDQQVGCEKADEGECAQQGLRRGLMKEVALSKGGGINAGD